MEKNNKECCLRDFCFSIAEMIAYVEDCERLCPTDTIMEMCETLAGIMAEQTKIIARVENVESQKELREIRNEFRRPLVGERFYSSHLDALCDLLRLAKHMKEVIEAKDRLLSSIEQLKHFKELPPINVKLISSTLEAIPRVKTLRSDE